MVIGDSEREKVRRPAAVLVIKYYGLALSSVQIFLIFDVGNNDAKFGGNTARGVLPWRFGKS